MGYLHIDNLYKAQEILLFRRCYAMEKVHGTSAHVSWNEGRLGFFAGGESYDRFVKLFDHAGLTAKLTETFGLEGKVTVFGEAYGGKCQGMSKTYGKELRFVVFDVQIGESWLSVPRAFDLVSALGLDFVAFEEIDTDLSAIDAERDRDSSQAIKNGLGTGHIREGIVLRPLVEVTLNNGRRVIAKYKREEFAERATIPEVDPAKREIMENADAIAGEWVTAMRLTHVLDSLRAQGIDVSVIQATGTVIAAMTEDVTREAVGEIVENNHVKKAIGAKAAKMFKAYLSSSLKENSHAK